MIAYLTPEQWAHLLQEGTRILRPGGVLRLTENDVVCTSPATDTLFSLFYRAMAQMQIEIHADDFCAVMFLLTAWGEKPR